MNDPHVTPTPTRSDRARRAAAATARTKALLRPVPDPVSAERFYSDPEAEYLRALEAYRVQYQIRYLSASDHLHVLTHILGYQRV